MTPTLQLLPDELHLWSLGLDRGLDGVDLRALAAPLDASERERMAEFASDRLRREFAATRVLCRRVLSRYVPATLPEAWRFDRNAWGRPHAVLPAGAPAIDFNLSHSDGVIVMAVARASRRIGVDVEAVDPARTASEIARRFFSRAECLALEALPAPRRAAGFFELWTAKEAYVKARGIGLSMPLDSFSVEIDPCTEAACRARLSTAPADDDPGLWRLFLSDFPPRHKLALCARLAEPDESLVLRRFEFPSLA